MYNVNAPSVWQFAFQSLPLLPSSPMSDSSWPTPVNSPEWHLTVVELRLLVRRSRVERGLIKNKRCSRRTKKFPSLGWGNSCVNIYLKLVRQCSVSLSSVLLLLPLRASSPSNGNIQSIERSSLAALEQQRVLPLDQLDSGPSPD